VFEARGVAYFGARCRLGPYFYKYKYKYKIKFVERAVVDKVESEALGGQR